MVPVLRIKIKDAINMIVNNSLLLPAIQREYVWKKQAIELMFDSILRDYPINTLMFWRINNICQQQLDFYSFLKPNYIYGITSNDEYPKTASDNGQKLIVIDGQQRLTSIYIGLYGTYQTEKGMPMSLYLRLDAPANDLEKHYDFRFLSDSQSKKLQAQGHVLFKMNDLTKPNYNIFSKYMNLSENEFAVRTMTKLNTLLTTDEYLHYYDIDGYNSIDDVLEIFTRTNNSGTRLSKGDLLLSVLTTQWKSINPDENAREYVRGIIDSVKGIGYKIDRDWVIKCCLVMFCDNIKMQVSNFSSTQVNGQSLPNVIYKNKEEFRDSVLAAFKLICRFGLIEKGLSTKLAVIPIVQYIYEQKLWRIINKPHAGHTSHPSDTNIQKWLFRAIVLNLFEAGTDEILTKVKSIVNNMGTKDYFPYNEIENLYSQLRITPAVIEQLLSTQKISAFPILNIIFKDQIQSGKRYDMDHTHPEVLFRNIGNIRFTTPADQILASDGVTYNSVRNLQLLDERENKSKNKMDLSKWVSAAPNTEKRKKIMEDHCIPQNVSLDIKDYKSYIDERSKLLETLLKKNLSV